MDSHTHAIPNTRFGDLNVDADKIISLPDSIPGVAGLNQVIVLAAAGTEPFTDLSASGPDLHNSDVSEPVASDPGTDAFCWIQSVTDPDLAMLAVSPWAVDPAYEFEFDDSLLDSPHPEDLAVLCLVNTNSVIPTANLRAPLLINLSTRLARQIILPDDRWPIQTPLGD